MKDHPEQPLPIIDLSICDGCGLCVQACPDHALAIKNGKARITNPKVCGYHGYCEMICPGRVINRLFQIIISPQEL